MKTTFRIVMLDKTELEIFANGCDAKVYAGVKFYHFYIRINGKKEYIAIIPRVKIYSMTIEER